MKPYTVCAYNTALESENKIHDDAVANRLGFTGGLVPGVEVFAYMAHVPAALWGRDFLSGGAMHARFVRPVYDGDLATVTPRATQDSALALTLSARDIVCAEGSATRAAEGPGPALVPCGEVPRRGAQAKASPTTLKPGTVLGTLREFYMAEAARHYLRDVREDPALFDGGRLAHPGYLLRRANYVLAYTVALGPWIHSESRVRFHGLLEDGEPFETRAIVAENGETKGHLVAALDFTISSRERLVMSGRHWAIYEPRQVREAATG